jgi:hypothetical protein
MAHSLFSSASGIPSSSAARGSAAALARLARVPRIVPLTRKKGVSSFAGLNQVVCEYDLGKDAIHDTLDKGSALLRRVKPVIVKCAADHEGRVRKTWRQLGSETRGAMARELAKSTPWLSQFEEGWAVGFVLKRAINQRANDQNRRKVKERDARKEEILAQRTQEALGEAGKQYPFRVFA